MSLTNIWKYLSIFIVCLSIIVLFLLHICLGFEYVSEGILGITALVILWYTWETSETRKIQIPISEASQAELERIRRPIVAYKVFMNPDKAYDTRFRIQNLSEYAVAARVNCNLKLDGELIKDFSASYDGRHYWNLQYKETKEGHFSWLKFYQSKGFISQNEIQEIVQSDTDGIIKKIHEHLIVSFGFLDEPTLSMDVEVFCENEHGFSTYYPPVHYYLDHKRIAWVPILTSDKPYWLHGSKPHWVNEKVM